jgi:predicted SAM-dependent methyltransferase
MIDERRRHYRLKRLNERTGLLLDLGASSYHLPGWVTLDIAPDAGSIRMDARQRWPFRDGVASAIRAEQVIEHLTYDEADFCVGEMYRVLERGGVVRICTPDLEGIARAYLERDPRILDVHREHGYVAPTWSHLPNNYLRMWGHQHVFDFEALEHLLANVGFSEIERTPFNHSRHATLNGTDSHDLGELAQLVVCVDGVKAD